MKITKVKPVWGTSPNLAQLQEIGLAELLAQTYDIVVLCQDGVIRTKTDFIPSTDCWTNSTNEKVLQFSEIRCTPAALKMARQMVSSIEDTQVIEYPTAMVEQQGANLIAAIRDGTAQPTDYLTFSESVCRWGRGARVWANLIRHHGTVELAKKLEGAISSLILLNLTGREAISALIAIKGLGVSFGSKHLRMLFPEKFAVLDEIIELGLGFARGEAGFSLFIAELEKFKNKVHQFPELQQFSLSDVEMALFVLIRPFVRQQEEV